jgi:hypothetical protein
MLPLEISPAQNSRQWSSSSTASPVIDSYPEDTPVLGYRVVMSKRLISELSCLKRSQPSLHYLSDGAWPAALAIEAAARAESPHPSITTPGHRAWQLGDVKPFLLEIAAEIV